MKSLKEHDDEILDRYMEMQTYPQNNGIECPECKKELQDVDSLAIMSNPPKKRIECPNCGFEGFRYLS